jgi:hypothetical protein
MLFWSARACLRFRKRWQATALQDALAQDGLYLHASASWSAACSTALMQRSNGLAVRSAPAYDRHAMDDREAIEHYDRAGEHARGVSAFAPIRWPDLVVDPANLARLVEGVLDARCDCARLVFGEDFDASADAVVDRLSETWRTDALQVRFAPEGVFVRARISVLVELAADEHADAPEIPEAIDTLWFTSELCVSFTQRHHVRPFVDFMSGEVHRASDGAITRLDPFAREVSPQDAVEWGLNGG